MNDAVEEEVSERDGSLVDRSATVQPKPVPFSRQEELAKRNVLLDDGYRLPLEDCHIRPTGVTVGDERFMEYVTDGGFSKGDGRLVDNSALLGSRLIPNSEDDIFRSDDHASHPIDVNDSERHKDYDADRKATERDGEAVDTSALLEPLPST